MSSIEMLAIGCGNWHVMDNTDYNPYADPLSQKDGLYYGSRSKTVSVDNCQYHDGSERQLIKVNLQSYFGGHSKFQLYKSPHTTESQQVFYIRSKDRVSPEIGCPERSWLSWEDSDCNQDGDNALIRLVD